MHGFTFTDKTELGGTPLVYTGQDFVSTTCNYMRAEWLFLLRKRRSLAREVYAASAESSKTNGRDVRE